MASAARALKSVPDHPQEPVGDADLTRQTMAEWKEGQRRCRARKRHNWGPHIVWERSTGRGRSRTTTYEVVEICSHCRNKRTADFVLTARGLRKVGRWEPIYRDGYLLPRGAMRIDEDMHDELTASDILSRKVVEVPNEDDDDEPPTRLRRKKD